MIATRRPLVVALVAILLATGGLWLSVSGTQELRRKAVVVSGVPLDEVHPAGTGRRPGVVVAHGFAGSATLMAPFGDTLAAQGYVVVLLDFSGHGKNTHPLPVGDASTDVSSARLQQDLDVAVRHLRSLPDVDPARIALVGHSMGATTVTEYAADHPDIRATVAISLPDSAGIRTDLPHRLLLLVGGLELPSFHRAAQDAGRSVQVVPHVEHISILFSPRTHRAVVKWLDAAFGGPPDDAPLPSPLRRLGGACVLLLAALLGLYPVAYRVLGDARRPRTGPLSIVVPLAVTGVAALAGAVVAAVAPITLLPLAIGGYLVGLTLVTGALMLLYEFWRARTSAVPTEPAPQSPGKLAKAAVALLAYAVIAVAAPLQLGVTNSSPVGARWWLIGIVWAGFAVFAYAAERLAKGNTVGVLVADAVLTLALTVAALAGLTSTFVILVVPLLVALQLWQAFWSALLRRFAAPAWLVALVGSLVVAWPIATTLPIVS